MHTFINLAQQMKPLFLTPNDDINVEDEIIVSMKVKHQHHWHAIYHRMQRCFPATYQL